MNSVLDADKDDLNFTHTDFINDSFDIYGTLNYIYEKQHSGVRDFLVNTLYDFSFAEVDKILPQLIHLYIVFSENQSKILSEYIIKQCTENIHFGIKTILLLKGSFIYCDELQTERVNKLIRNCEMSVVNAQLPKMDHRRVLNIEIIADKDATPANKGSIKNKMLTFVKEKIHTPIKNISKKSAIYNDLEKKGVNNVNVGNDINNYSNHTKNDFHSLSTNKIIDNDVIDEMHSTNNKFTENCNKNSLNTNREEEEDILPNSNSDIKSEIEDTITNFESDLVMDIPNEHGEEFKESCNDSLSNSYAMKHDEHILHTPPTNPILNYLSPNSPRLNDDEVKAVLSKSIRSEYVNRLLHLFDTLEDISSKLTSISRNFRFDRDLKLRKYIDDIMSPAAFGLYFPCIGVNDQHYKILRIASEECFTLSSRDKVPYMLVIETELTNKTCYDKNIYESLTSILLDVEKTLEPNDQKQKLLYERYASIMLKNSNEDENVDDEDITPAITRTKTLESAYPDTSNRSESLKLKKSNKITGDLLYKLVWGESSKERRERLRKTSKFKSVKAYDVKSVIFKGGDDCRQELLAMQLISYIDSVFKKAKLPLQLQLYSVLVTSPTSGLIETIPNAISIDLLKKKFLNIQLC